MARVRFSDQPHGLPPMGFGFRGERWTSHLKAAVVEAINAGHISLQDTAIRYGVGSEEIISWCRAHQLAGRDGLRAGKGLAEVRPQTRFRTTRAQANARDIIPAEVHQGVSLPRLRFMHGGGDA